MTSQNAIKAIRPRLLRAMLSRLAMRWPKAHSYMPEGGNRVHCAQPLQEPDCDLFDSYVLGYQDAIEDMLNLMGLSEDPLGRAMALRLAETSVFQGGTVAPSRGKRSGDMPRTGDSPGRDGRNPAPGRRGRQPSEARLRAEGLFRSRGDGDAV